MFAAMIENWNDGTTRLDERSVSSLFSAKDAMRFRKEICGTGLIDVTHGTDVTHVTVQVQDIGNTLGSGHR
jgi:hypothetical protein